MEKRKGRPISDNPRDLRMELRMTRAEMEMLDACSSELEKTRSDTIREALLQMYMYLQMSRKEYDESTPSVPKAARLPADAGADA